jgi:hypothetical protein
MADLELGKRRLALARRAGKSGAGRDALLQEHVQFVERDRLRKQRDICRQSPAVENFRRVLAADGYDID